MALTYTCSFSSLCYQLQFYTLIGLIFILTTPFTSVTAQSSPSTVRFDGLTQRIDSIVKAHETPGVQVLVFTKDSLLYKHNVGVANLKTKSPVTDQSMFRLGSVTKSFVAVAALMLVEKGQLTLSDELKKLAPDIQFSNLWEATDPVRVVHLLEHTTGFDDWSMNAYAFNKDPNIVLERGLTLYSESRHSRWRPGTFMAYCNSGPPIIARILEMKTGQEFESFVQQRIFNPLGLKQITFRRDEVTRTHLVTNYSGDDRREERYWDILLRPAGSLNAPALELMPFVQMLMNRGTYQSTQLLLPSSIDRMETPTTTLAARAGSKDGYGLYNYTTSYKGYLFHGHNGGVNGGLAHYIYNSELNRGLIVLVNSDGAGFGTLADAVLETVMKNVPQRLPPAFALSTAQKENLPGYYRQSNIRASFTGWLIWLAGVLHIYEADGNLFINNLLNGETVLLRPIGPGQFIRMDKTGYTSQVTLTRNDAGQAVAVMPSTNTTETSAIGAWLPLILGSVSMLLVVTGLLMGIVCPILNARLKRKGGRLSAMPVRMSFAAYAFSLVVMLLAGMVFARGDELGLVTPVSVTVFVASVLIPVCAIWAFISLIRRQRQIPNRTDQIFLWVAVSSALLVVGYMAVWGLVGLRTWI
ncbi:serine hydrolase domain-containing protein [Spirosoma arcticum]